MNISNLKTRAEDFYYDHFAVLTGTICGIAGATLVYYGYQCGRHEMIFAVHAGVLGDVDKFLDLCEKGIRCYNGRNLKRLNKAAVKFVNMKV